jgi:hypothetical protein
MKAAFYCHLEVVKVLVHAGADKDIENEVRAVEFITLSFSVQSSNSSVYIHQDGKTAIDLAQTEEIRDALRSGSSSFHSALQTTLPSSPLAPLVKPPHACGVLSGNDNYVDPMQ